ncbi:DUF6197 family protein [Mycolicibacterium phlei]|uniref:DUF6197 family protein n=1 Tax=Mycolicibacterium phlei TaxID=1771 RepID=UPI0010409775|nr:hypothetical protein [Mycolicibacterium phlei]MBF4194560.1 hypothetical protein [Mycolicibacterium phlei]
MSDTVTILKRAEEILSDPKRWHRGDFVSGDGEAFCSLGAIREAYRERCQRCDPFEAPATVALHHVLAEEYPEWAKDDPVFLVPNWNDAPQRRHAEVLAMFQKARAYAAEKGL